jgi:PTH1 family peptidyl-tRNA hydrolase
MKLIVGLGNPGEKYRITRHNVGFMFVDFLGKDKGNFSSKNQFKAEILEIGQGDSKLILAKPQTFMNNSGDAVSRIMQFYKIKKEDVTVAHDDLDILFGEFKINFAKGPKIHNGIISIEEHIHTSEFTRVRIGVDARISENRIPGQEYVLSSFTPEEQKKLNAIFNEIEKSL